MKNFSSYRAPNEMLMPAQMNFNCNSPPFLMKRQAIEIEVHLRLTTNLPFKMCCNFSGPSPKQHILFNSNGLDICGCSMSAVDGFVLIWHAIALLAKI